MHQKGKNPMRKQKESEASILSLRENITTFTKDLKHALRSEVKEEKINAPEGQESNKETEGIHKPDKPEC